MKNPVALTLFLLSPLAVVGGIVWWISVSLNVDRAMEAEDRGAGANDTGGANAIGEWLAGRDPDVVEQRNRAVRTGDAMYPADVDVPILLATLPPPAVGRDAGLVAVLRERRGEAREIRLMPAEVDGALAGAMLFGEGVFAAVIRPGELRRQDQIRFDAGTESASTGFTDLPLMKAVDTESTLPVLFVPWSAEG
ncbi:MAG: hypothetical protein AAF235_08465 [Planctomycetota bacterium]